MKVWLNNRSPNHLSRVRRHQLLIVAILLWVIPAKDVGAQTLTGVNSKGETFTIEWGPAQQAMNEGYQRLVERKPRESLDAFARALSLAREAGWSDAQIAGIHSGKADALFQLGRFSDAMEAIDRAIPHETGRSHANAILRKSDLARAMGDFRTATNLLDSLAPGVFVVPHDREPDQIRQRQRMEEWARQAIFLSEARNRRAWGDLLGAKEMFERTIEEGNTSAEVQRDYARTLLALGEHANALQHAQTALGQSLHTRGTTRRRPRHQWVQVGDAEVLSCLMVAAECALANGDRSTADAHFETAALLAQHLGLIEDWHLARLSRARAWVLAADDRRQGISAEWLQSEVSGLADSDQSRARIEGQTIAGQIAFVLGDYSLTVRFLQAAVVDIENIRASANFEDRREFLALQADNYRRLTAAHIRLQQPWDALVAAEALKARQLNELIDPDATPLGRTERLANLRSFQRRLPADVAAINYANVDWAETPPAAIVVTRESITAIELSTARLRFELEYLPRERILEAQHREVDVNRYGTSDEVTLAGLIAFYREALACRPQDISARVPDVLAVSPVLHTLLIAPLHEALGNRQRLLIAPNGLLHYLPFDTLIHRNTFLASSHSLTLTPSFETTMILAARQPGEYARPLIAFGGAVYNPENYAKVMAGVGDLREQIRLMREVRQNEVAANRSPYFGVFGGPSTNLAGTQAEVEELGDLFPGSTIVIGRSVSERNVRDLARQGRLRDSRVVHFAVHGSALPSMPELSCLSLSFEGHFTRTMPPENDGKLSLAEIRALPLRADLVSLSACETGLGAIFAGEGVVGLTAAFLSAGSDRVLSSLWAVNDVSTTFFMVDFYRLHFIEGMPADLAIATVKRAFIAGSPAGFRHPQYWAPFNIYGGADLLLPDPSRG